MSTPGTTSSMVPADTDAPAIPAPAPTSYIPPASEFARLSARTAAQQPASYIPPASEITRLNARSQAQQQASLPPSYIPPASEIARLNARSQAHNPQPSAGAGSVNFAPAVNQWASQAQAAAAKYGVPTNLILSTIQHESGGDPNSRNPTSSAAGLGNFLAGTAKQYGINPLDPNQAIDGIGHYYSDLLKEHGGNLRAAIQGYRGVNDVPYINSVYAAATSGQQPTRNAQPLHQLAQPKPAAISPKPTPGIANGNGDAYGDPGAIGLPAGAAPHIGSLPATQPRIAPKPAPAPQPGFFGRIGNAVTGELAHIQQNINTQADPSDRYIQGFVKDTANSLYQQGKLAAGAIVAGAGGITGGTAAPAPSAALQAERASQAYANAHDKDIRGMVPGTFTDAAKAAGYIAGGQSGMAKDQAAQTGANYKKAFQKNPVEFIGNTAMAALPLIHGLPAGIRAVGDTADAIGDAATSVRTAAQVAADKRTGYDPAAAQAMAQGSIEPKVAQAPVRAASPYQLSAPENAAPISQSPVHDAIAAEAAHGSQSPAHDAYAAAVEQHLAGHAPEPQSADYGISHADAVAVEQRVQQAHAPTPQGTIQPPVTHSPDVQTVRPEPSPIAEASPAEQSAGDSSLPAAPAAKAEFSKTGVKSPQSAADVVQGMKLGGAFDTADGDVGTQAANMHAIIEAQAETTAKRTGETVPQAIQRMYPEIQNGRLVEAPSAPPANVTEALATQPESVPDTAIPGGNRYVENFPVSEINSDPARFQYKVNQGAGGQTGSLTDAESYNPDFGGALQVWKDPQDGKTYVVNGHNRLALAQRTGTPGVDVRYIDADTAEKAKAQGALINIAEGHGNAVDAAQFMRGSGYTPDDLKGMGVNLRGPIARQGAALSRLHPSIFGSAVRGELPVDHAATIGEKLPNHPDQLALSKMLDRAAAQNKKIDPAYISELADAVKNAPSETHTQAGLFGDEDTTQNLALERADVASYVRTNLAQEGRLFGTASKNAGRLAKGNNTIDAERSGQLAQTNRQGVDLFDSGKNSKGAVSDLLNKAAARIGRGENAAAVKRDALNEYQQLIPELTKGGHGHAPSGDVGAGESGEQATGFDFGTLGGEDRPEQDEPRQGSQELTSAQHNAFRKAYRDYANGEAGNPSPRGMGVSETDAAAIRHEVEGESGTLHQVGGGKQTDTPEFKRWFGDSKVVDDQGRPLVVYHGTKAGFNQFDEKKFGQSDPGLAGKGFYFTYNPEEASGYALNDNFGKGESANVIPAYVSIHNPLKIVHGVLPDGQTLKELHGGGPITAKGGAAVRKIADDGGHDGVAWMSRDGQVRHVVAFQPEQIKSAIGNRGTFDASDPNILHQKAEGAPNNPHAETPEFKKFFENSKIVDTKGNPLTVYHGSPKAFDTFDANKSSQGSGNHGFYGAGHYFTNKADTSLTYAESEGEKGHVISANLAIRRPFNVNLSDHIHHAIANLNYLSDNEIARIKDYHRDGVTASSLIRNIGSRRFTELLKQNGYDGIVVNSKSGDHEYVAFYPEQIKSAIGNRGTFDSNDPNILHQMGTEQNNGFHANGSPKWLVSRDGGTSKLNINGKSWTIQKGSRSPVGAPGIRFDDYKLTSPDGTVTSSSYPHYLRQQAETEAKTPDYHTAKQQAKTAASMSQFHDGRTQTAALKAAQDIVRNTPEVSHIKAKDLQTNILDAIRGSKHAQDYIRGIADRNPHIGNDLEPVAKMAQVSRDAYDAHMAAQVKVNDFHNRGVFYQSADSPRGSVALGIGTKDTGALMKFFHGAKLDTAVHETAHIWRRNLDPHDLAYLEQHYGVEGGNWTREHEERFAEDTTNYFKSGKAPTAKLQPIFDQFKDFLTRIYDKLGKSQQAQVSPQVRAVLDRALGSDRELPPLDATDDAAEGKAESAPGGTAKPKAKGEYVANTRLANPNGTGQKYAASLNLDRMDTTDDVRAAIAEHAKRLEPSLDEARRKGVTQADTVAAVKEIGLTVPQAMKGKPASVPLDQWIAASRDLLLKKESDFRAAQNENASTPTPQNQAAEDAARKDFETIMHVAAGNATEASRALSIHKQYSQAARATESGASEDLFKPVAAKNAGTAKTFGDNNRYFTTDKAAAARQRFLNQVKAEPDAGNALYQSAPPTPSRKPLTGQQLKDLTEIGGFHLEGGVRDYTDWSKQMQADTQGRVSDTTLQRVWNNIKIESSQRQARASAPRTGSAVLIDKLAQRIGRPGAQQFLDSLTNPDGSSPAYDKLAAGEERTPQEERQIKAALTEAYKAKADGKAPTPAQKLSQSATDLNAIARDARLQAKAEAQVTQTPEQAKAATQAKIANGLSDDDADRFKQEIADLKPGDHTGFIKVMQKYSRMTVADSLTGLWKAGLLSHIPVFAKVAASHIGYTVLEEAKRMPAALADMAYSAARGTDRQVAGLSVPAMARAARIGATKGLKESGIIIAHGEAGLKLRGASMHSMKGTEIPEEYNSNLGVASRPANAYVNTIGRLHGALYHPSKVYAFDRAIDEQAQLAARQDVKNGVGTYQDRYKHYYQNPTTAMIVNGVDAADELVFQNKNRAASIIGSIKAQSGPYRPIVEAAAPFGKVVTNVVLKGLDYTTGVPRSIGMLVKAEMEHKVFTPEQQRNFAQTFGRGTVGAGTIALGAYLYNKKLVTPADSKSHTPAMLKVGSKYYPIGDKAPAGMLLNAGAIIARGGKTSRADLTSALIGEAPIVGDNNQASTLIADPERFAGGMAESVVPGFVQDIAGHIDPVRRKPTDITKNGKTSVPQFLAQSVEQGVPGLSKNVPPDGARAYDPLDPLKLRNSALPPPVPRKRRPINSLSYGGGIGRGIGSGGGL